MEYDTHSEHTVSPSLFSMIARIADKRWENPAVTEECDMGNISRNYGSLIKDAEAAAEYIEERASPSAPIRIRGGGAYDKAVLILAASYSGRQVMIERGYLTSEPRTELTLKNGESFTITFEELRPLISGILALPRNKVRKKKGAADVTFVTMDGQKITYSEDAVILSALTFGHGAALSGRDRLMYCLDEDTPEGLFCGLIAPLIFGGCAIGCHTLKYAMRTIRDFSPTKILCKPKVARAMLLKMKKIKKREPRPLIIRRREGDGTFEGFDIDPTRVLLRRLASPRVASAFGGRLRSVIVWGELSEMHIDRFFSFGIYAVTMLSEPGLTPSLFHYGGDKAGIWRLPEGVYVDVCNVQKGGIGNFMFYSHAICRGKESADTLLPGEIRCDSLSGRNALISGMRGFVVNDSKIFITER